MRLLNYFKKLLAKSTVSPEERWLSQSVDLVDLERRQRLCYKPTSQTTQILKYKFSLA